MPMRKWFLVSILRRDGSRVRWEWMNMNKVHADADGEWFTRTRRYIVCNVPGKIQHNRPTDLPND